MNADQFQPLSAEAWLLSFDNGLYAAVGRQELQHIVHSPVTFTIPFCPYYCDQVLIWNDRLLPVIDLTSRLTDGRQTCRSALVGIVAYLRHDVHTPYYAGLRIHSVPQRLQVYDEQACALPQDIPAWRDIAASCFSYPNNKPVPILDLPRIFSNTPQPEEAQRAASGMRKGQMSPQV
jgi:chemotaxis signal transduction protein